MRKFFIMAAATAMSLSVTSIASADTCDSDVVLVQGSSASQAIIQALAPVAYALTPSVKIVYSNVGSSGGGVYDTLFPPSGTGGVPTGSATIYYLGGTATSCTFDAAQPTDVIGVSDVYPSSLAGVAIGAPFPTMPSPVTLPADVVDTLGPVQAFTISVHDDPSFPVAISAEAAFNTFGITAKTTGDASFAVAPWTVIGEIYGRGEGSGTWQTWARNLGLITSKPVSTPAANTGAVLSGLTMNADAAAIGIVALNDLVSAQLNATAGSPISARPLAFRAYNQDFAYYTSSTATATDMINVRDGHYQTWANLHFLAHKNTGGDFSANVKAVLGLLETQQAIQAVAKIRAVPNCAMQVSRSSDGGDFSAYTPTKPCGCFFEASSSGTAPATCKTCTADGDCGASGQCDFGFCEAK